MHICSTIMPEIQEWIFHASYSLTQKLNQLVRLCLAAILLVICTLLNQTLLQLHVKQYFFPLG